MRKSKAFIVIAFILLLFVDCSLLNIGSKFTPPGWIQGTWTDNLEVTSYTFTTDNVTQTIGGYSINLGLAYIGATITETTSDTLYSFSINQSGSIATYSFDKVTDTTISYTVTASGTTSPAVELTKE